MAPSRVRVLPLVLGLAGLAVAGTAAAYLIRQNRDVTTTSDQAYRLYKQGVENDLKLYERDAMSSYAEALRFDPHFVMATLRLAEKMRGRDPERAKSLLAGALKSRDEVSARERLLLDIYEERWGKRDLKKLEALYGEYVRRFPKDPEGYKMRADFLSMNGRTPEAIEEYGRLLEANPNYAHAYNTLGYYWASKGDAAKAEDYLKRYRYLAPNDANPYDSLGELYAHTGRYDEAEENLKKALAIKDDFFPSYGHLGTVETGRGHYDKAAEWFRKASETADQLGNQFNFQFLAAMVLVEGGRVDEAVKVVDEVSQRAASLPVNDEMKRMRTHVAFRRAALLGRIGRTAEAEKALAEADFSVFRDPKDPSKNEWLQKDMDLVRGVIAMGAGRDADAVGLLRNAIDRKDEKGLGSTDYYPSVYFARQALATSLGRLGRPDEAADALAPILKKNPNFAPAVQVLARVRGGAAAPKAASAS